MLVRAADGPAYVIVRAEWLSAARANPPGGAQPVAFQVSVRVQEVVFGLRHIVSGLFAGQGKVRISRRVIHARPGVIWHRRLAPA
jgi:hypothetical protein